MNVEQQDASLQQKLKALRDAIEFQAEVRAALLRAMLALHRRAGLADDDFADFIAVALKTVKQ